jgi:Spy/CpxP family protein refolding chaperone
MILFTMKSNPQPAHTMKLIIAFVLLASLVPLFAGDESKPGSDPLAGAFFPPELILLAHDQIGLTPDQMAAFRAQVEKTQSHSEELRAKLELETAALAALAKPDRVDEAALGAQLDKVLDVERELKHLHIGLLAAIKNQLTPEQESKLRELAKDGVSQLEETVRQRLTEKVECVKEGAQKWAAAGRDPAVIGRAMEEKVKPLMDAGKPLEAEAELDRLLEQLKTDAK